MFDHGRNVSNSSGIEVHHSSPIAVPNTSSKQITPKPLNTPPGQDLFSVGGVPVSPAPLQKASVQESILNGSRSSAASMLSNQSIQMEGLADPNPTPMPGTNLTLDGIHQPDIVSSSDAATPVKGGNWGSYFPPMVNSDCQKNKLVDSAATTNSSGTSINVDPGTVSMLQLLDGEHIEGTGPDGISGKLEPISPDTAPLPDPEGEPFILDPEARKSLEASNGCASAYLALDGTSSADDDQCGLERRRSTWGRNTGLYDGTGYDSEDDAAPIAHDEFSPPPYVVDGLVESAQEIISSENSSAREAWGAINSSSEHFAHRELDHPSVPIDQISVVDEKETLQDIIRAYARSPMFHDGETREERAGELHGSLSEEEAEAFSEDFAEKEKEEVALSIRIRNRSLGG
ncbi:uncharacterized protein BDR25DRAFT_129966 [Lindgomyces ingoldianus]|uniref:Uncharacterized protein n=1 Tax=Lindgomyces ingoldianus TaxID=673940 RepID=A0ACB6R1U6_9PLEO|nr:uncharacterized protein BDR25DRAFT_129966 [Lindgomyces ingoldianus]KAF2473233.1 hypothetical protein BDR25DRAFT_129966 [Lindgomyces ingoldianus]